MRATFMFLLLSILPVTALAELYISPVTRSTVTYDDQAREAAEPDSGLVIKGRSSRHGEFELGAGNRKEDASSGGDLMRYGHNVPLFVALEHIVPESEDWVVHIDPKVEEDKPVSWEGGGSWEGVLKQIEAGNDLSIALNQSEKALGVARKAEVSAALAYQVPRAWRTDPKKNMEENLRAWLTMVDYQLVWDDSIKDLGYDIISETVLPGQLFGEGGVIDRMLQVTSRREKPLGADTYHGDRVVHVRPARYTSQLDQPTKNPVE